MIDLHNKSNYFYLSSILTDLQNCPRKITSNIHANNPSEPLMALLVWIQVCKKIVFRIKICLKIPFKTAPVLSQMKKKFKKLQNFECAHISEQFMQWK